MVPWYRNEVLSIGWNLWSEEHPERQPSHTFSTGGRREAGTRHPTTHQEYPDPSVEGIYPYTMYGTQSFRYAAVLL